jgi:hypothetical protein
VDGAAAPECQGRRIDQIPADWAGLRAQDHGARSRLERAPRRGLLGNEQVVDATLTILPA